MKSINNKKELNYGKVMRYLRRKQIAMPSLSENLVEIRIELLDWYTACIHSLMPNSDLEIVRDAIARAMESREISFRDIQDMKLKKEEIKECL